MKGRKVKYTKELIDKIVKEFKTPSEIKKELMRIGMHNNMTSLYLEKYGYKDYCIFKQYSKDDDELLLKKISENPYNLKSAFEKFSEETGRNSIASATRYYTYLRKNNPNRILLVGNSRLASNTKNVARGRELHPELVVSINGIRYQSSSLSSINISF